MKAVKAGAQLHVSWPSGAASKQYDFAADAPAEKALIAQAMQHMLMQQVLPLSQESVCIARMYMARLVHVEQLAERLWRVTSMSSPLPPFSFSWCVILALSFPKACVSACIVRHTTDRCLLHCIAWVGSGKAA